MKSNLYRILAAILLVLPTLSIDLSAQTTASPNSSGNTEQQRPHIFQNLDLTDAQKAQIKQIRQDTPKGQERRQEIAAVLTPAQKAQAKADAEQWKAQHPSN